MPVSKNRRKNGRKATPAMAPPGRKGGTVLPADIVVQSEEFDELSGEFGELSVDYRDLGDRRAAERALAEVHAAEGSFPMGPESDPLARAQEIMYDAFDARGKPRRIELARRALEVSPLCADAHVLLGEEASADIHEAKAHFEAGVAAGEKALGPETFGDSAGLFWGLLQTRPYMRARANLASCLWDLGEREAAIGHLREMLLLNPTDNQGLREIQAGWLMAAGDYDELDILLKVYEEPGATNWDYTTTLLKFRRKGPSKEARRALQSAFDGNPHVPPLLTGERGMPGRMPANTGRGSLEEGVIYVRDNMETWSSVEGAVEWLAAETRGMEQGAEWRGKPAIRVLREAPKRFNRFA